MTGKEQKPWRERYRVHPLADVFPMLDPESGEFEDFKADIGANGIKVPVPIWTDKDGTEWLMDARNRLEVADQLGLAGEQVPHVHVKCDDPAAYVISLNLHRRHLTKEQQADLIVKVREAAEASRQDGERHARVKAAVIADAKQHGISKRTAERSLAKVKGRPKKKRATKPKTCPVPDDIAAIPDDQAQQMCMPCGTPIDGMTITGAQMKEAFRTGQLQYEKATLKQCEAAVYGMREWAMLMLYRWKHLPKGVPAGVPAEQIERWREWITETRKALDIAEAALTDSRVIKKPDAA